MTDEARGWQIFVDRGGTFTDIIAITPNKEYRQYKLLSHNPEHYDDAVIEGIRKITDVHIGSLSSLNISKLNIGTTVATNALLERKGEPTLFCITKGFADLLEIRSQNRDHIFAREIIKQPPLYSSVVEIEERINTHGDLITPLNIDAAEHCLQEQFQRGLRSIAIVLMHGYQFPQHETKLAELAKAIGFKTIITSHQSNPLIRILPRAETSVIDAYLTPVLHSYTLKLQKYFPQCQLGFMQSNGELCDADNFHGKNAVLSGPAGGMVGMSKTATAEGFNQIVGFDMGGTSTDVSLYQENFEISSKNTIAGSHLRVPMLKVHTVAAGGGSLLGFLNERLQVGPESAGAEPGPASYGKQGPLAVTDIQVMLGRIRPEYFPQVFGTEANQPLDTEAVKQAFSDKTQQIFQTTGQQVSVEQLAMDYLTIAIAHMAGAIRTISTARGIPLDDFVLCAFGGAGGQHACLVADELGIKQVLIHRASSVLSAYGIGSSNTGLTDQKGLEQILDDQSLQTSTVWFSSMFESHKQQLTVCNNQTGQINQEGLLACRYEGMDTFLYIEPGSYKDVRASFELKHQQQFGFVHDKENIIIDHLKAKSSINAEALITQFQIHEGPLMPEATHSAWFNDCYTEVPYFKLARIPENTTINGPAIIFDNNTTIVVEPGWKAQLTKLHNLLLEKNLHFSDHSFNSTQLDPMRLELFNHRFMEIAHQMGAVLQKTATSVNIRERLDFSCALFDKHANLVANAPHMPVHLGSMGDSVKSVLENPDVLLKENDTWLINSPYSGGTHLPDITAVSPIFIDGILCFFVASRGHHADIGGITPGSMPANSKHINDEGIIFDCFLLVRDGHFYEDALYKKLLNNPFPARSPDQVVADLRAQLASNTKGIQELKNCVELFGLQTVTAYMQHVQDNAEVAVKNIIQNITPGKSQMTMDCGSTVCVAITTNLENEKIFIDFTGTSETLANNYNAPRSVTMAAILYVIRCLIDENIPLNAGCLRPVEVNIPENCFLSCTHPSAVVAGNVETSQCVTDALFAALGVQAGAQGTMNNLTFGNNRFQYYETIAGGTGAGDGYHGANAVQSHMTNSRITDPEILEARYPVILDYFRIRQDSYGFGKWHGGNGIERKITFNEAVEVSVLSNNRLYAPQGLKGGQDGLSGKNKVIRGSMTEHYPATFQTRCEAGDAIEILTPGGGGFGKPS